MGNNFLVLGLSLYLLLSSFHEVSCQDDSGLSTLDLIERDYQASVNALQEKEDENQSAQSENQNTTVTDKNTISLSLSYESDAAQRQKMLEDIERDFEAASISLEQLKIGELTQGNDEEQSAKRKSLLEEIEQEFEAATKNLEQLKVNDFTGDKDDQEQSAQRKSILEAIEREFEAAVKGLEKLQVSDSTGSKDDKEQSAKRLSLLEEIEQEFEAATKGLQTLAADNNVEGQAAKRQSMLEEIEREFEAATKGLKETKTDDSRNVEERSSKRKIMLEEIEREFEEAQSGHSVKDNKEETSKKQSSSTTPGSLGLGQSSLCGCFNQENDGSNQDEESSIVIPTKFSIEEILSEDSAAQGTETSSLSASLTQLVENHRKEKESHNVHKDFTSSSSSTSESAASSETIESLSAKLKELCGLTARELVTRKDFEQILVTAARFEELSSAPISYISRLAKYGKVMKEGLEASARVHIANARAKLLKEAAMEKQTVVDAHFTNAKTLAQRGDALYVRILAIKKLLAKLEGEKESVDGKFKEIMNGLSHLLADASEAYEEYHEAVRKAKDEEAAHEFAREATQSAEIIWIKFLSSL